MARRPHNEGPEAGLEPFGEAGFGRTVEDLDPGIAANVVVARALRRTPCFQSDREKTEGPRGGQGGIVESKNDGQSVKELVGSLTQHFRDLLAREVELAARELSEKGDQVKQGVVSLTAGGAAALSGFILVLEAVSIGLGFILSTFLPVWIWGWLAPLMIGGISLAIGGGMAKRGTNLLRPSSFVPYRSVRSLKEDAQCFERLLK